MHVIKPIRITQVMKAADVVQSFPYMRLGQHIGKVVLHMQDVEDRSQVGKSISLIHVLESLAAAYFNPVLGYSPSGWRRYWDQHL